MGARYASGGNFSVCSGVHLGITTAPLISPEKQMKPPDDPMLTDRRYFYAVPVLLGALVAIIELAKAGV
jgi:hypothetical protein